MLVLDLGALEHTPVNLAVLGTATPGGSVTVETSGTSGLPVLLLAGLAPDDARILPIGYLGVDLGVLCACVPWTPAPSSIVVDIPASVAPVDVWAQQIAFSGPAAAFSNVVLVEIR